MYVKRPSSTSQERLKQVLAGLCVAVSSTILAFHRALGFTQSTVHNSFSQSENLPMIRTLVVSFSLIITLALPCSSRAETISIEQLHGPGSVSPYLDQQVTVEGVVTLALPTGFWLQTASDQRPTSRQGLYVFTATPAPIGEGDQIRVTGYVDRFRRPEREQDRWLTRLIQPSDLQILASDQPLPPALQIGGDGLRVPANLHDDDPVIDPLQSASDFWTWLTGMRVEVNEHRVIDPTNRFGDTWVITPIDHPWLNDHSVLVANPAGDHLDRIQITAHPLLRPSVPQPALPGDQFQRIDGVVHYARGGYRIQARHALQLERAEPGRYDFEPVTALGPKPDDLTVASYNVLNLDPVIERLGRVEGERDVDDAIGSGRMAKLGSQIAVNLANPDIIALQEIQDNNGAEQGDVVAADRTYQALIEAIKAAGGEDYSFIDLHPIKDSEGGQPGGNIRNGFLFNPARVELIASSPERWMDPAFDRSRAPVLAGFKFNGHRVNLINNHFSSKGGSSPLFGEGARIVGRAGNRLAQARSVRDLLLERNAWNEDAHWIVLGDLNDHWFSEPLSALKGGDPGLPQDEFNQPLINLIEGKPLKDRWTFIFRGTAQAIDHILTTPELAERAEFEVVHVNARSAEQAADHEPVLARFHLPKEARN